MKYMIILWLVVFSIVLKVRFEQKINNHKCDTIVVTIPVTDTISEYICMTEYGSHHCGFDPVKAADMMQAR